MMIKLFPFVSTSFVFVVIQFVLNFGPLDNIRMFTICSNLNVPQFNYVGKKCIHPIQKIMLISPWHLNVCIVTLFYLIELDNFKKNTSKIPQAEYGLIIETISLASIATLCTKVTYRVLRHTFTGFRFYIMRSS